MFIVNLFTFNYSLFLHEFFQVSTEYSIRCLDHWVIVFRVFVVSQLKLGKEIFGYIIELLLSLFDLKFMEVWVFWKIFLLYRVKYSNWIVHCFIKFLFEFEFGFVWFVFYWFINFDFNKSGDFEFGQNISVFSLRLLNIIDSVCFDSLLKSIIFVSDIAAIKLFNYL